MADDSGDQSRTSDEDWSNFDDSEEAGSVSDGTNSGSNDDDLTDRQSDESSDNENVPSDTETRNLLEDADFEEDLLITDEQATTNFLNTAVTSTSERWNDKIYAMTREQQEYYDQLFLHLQYITTGDAHLDGAINGAETAVVEFLKKSNLDTITLGKIWDLADMNVDGKLNRYEFSVAVHLIVLHKKGFYPIPPRLPKFFDLRMTPPRTEESPRSSEGNSMGSSQNSAFSAALTQTSTKNPVKQQSLSDDKLHSLYERNETQINTIREFAKDPPFCVDRVPQAIRSNHGSNVQLTGKHSLGSTTLIPPQFPTNLPKGPPPEPPPRAYTKGHGRSASLDLPNLSVFASPRICQNELNNGLLMTNSDLNPFGMPDQRCFTLPATSMPPTLSHKSSEQIVTRMNDVCDSRKPSSDIPNSSSEDSSISKKIPLLSPPPLPLKPDYHSRCTVLRHVNAELENKLATLSQIRLQLKLRVEEVQGKSNGPNLPQK